MLFAYRHRLEAGQQSRAGSKIVGLASGRIRGCRPGSGRHPRRARSGRAANLPPRRTARPRRPRSGRSRCWCASPARRRRPVRRRRRVASAPPGGRAHRFARPIHAVLLITGSSANSGSRVRGQRVLLAARDARGTCRGLRHLCLMPCGHRLGPQKIRILCCSRDIHRGNCRGPEQRLQYTLFAYLEPSAGLVPPQSTRAGVIATAPGAQIRSCSA